jgi:GTP-binding protein EngB required for normal cell division
MKPILNQIVSSLLDVRSKIPERDTETYGKVRAAVFKLQHIINKMDDLDDANWYVLYDDLVDKHLKLKNQYRDALNKLKQNQ